MTTAATGVAAGGAVAATTTEHTAGSAGAHRQPQARRKPSSFGVFAGSLAAFFALLAFLAVQVRAGGDPALGPAKPAATAEPRRVIVHRVIVRRVIVTEAAPRVASGGGSAGGGEAAGGGGGSAPAPCAPAQSAPAAPAPAPAAPVTTGSS